MSIFELILLGVALAMDAFAVTISNTFCYKGAARWRFLMLPVAFGIFQGLMPLLGYFLGGLVGSFIEAYAGIITLIILGLIGGNMIKEGVEALREGKSDEERCDTCGCQGVVDNVLAAAGEGSQVEVTQRPETQSGNGFTNAAVPAAVLTLGVIFMQSVATSIDAFAVGVSLRAENVDVMLAAAIITLTTFACCLAALAVGKRFGNLLGDRAQIVGGVVLVCIGLKAMFF